MSSGIEVKIDMRVLLALSKETPARASRWLRGVAQEIVSDIKLSFGTGPAGRAYRRTGGRRGKDGRFRGKVHIASAPPGPPAVDMGALRASITATVESPTRVIIHDQVEYGAHLEFGTSRMVKRPFFAPVLARWRNGKFADAARAEGLDVK
jgi:hypothetical protein